MLNENSTLSEQAKNISIQMNKLATKLKESENKNSNKFFVMYDHEMKNFIFTPSSIVSINKPKLTTNPLYFIHHVMGKKPCLLNGKYGDIKEAFGELVTFIIKEKAMV